MNHFDWVREWAHIYDSNMAEMIGSEAVDGKPASSQVVKVHE